jgi:hypothetical protein
LLVHSLVVPPISHLHNVRQSVQHSLNHERRPWHRHQHSRLKKEKRAQGETWVLFFRTTRQSDGKRVENKIPIGLVRQLPDANSAWAEVARPHVPINRVDVRRGLTFGALAQHYAEHELVECAESIRPKAQTTIKSYERVLRNRLLPRWKNRIALGIEPLEVEQWLRTLKRSEILPIRRWTRLVASCPWSISMAKDTV